MANRLQPRRTVSRAWYLLLLLPFVGLLWPPFYAKATPKLLGFPYFYWYQFLWVPIGAAVTAVVYRATTPPAGETPTTAEAEAADDDPRADGGPR
jgi:hypothetical protein